MENLQDLLSKDELELAKKIASEIAEKILLEFTNKKEFLANEIEKLKDEDIALKEQYSSTSEWELKSNILEKRNAKSALIKIKENQLKNIDNQLKVLFNGGNLVSFEDKTGQSYKQVPDFRKIKTDIINFNEETILVDEAPIYIPIIDEEKFERRGAVLDAIRMTEDTYIVCFSDYKYRTFEGQSEIFLLTLDQLVLTNLYYLTKLKAVYLKRAEEKTNRAKEYYFNLPIERRERHYSQKGFYKSLNKTIQKKYTEQEWESLPLSEKEKLAPAYKVYGSEKIKSSLKSNEMYNSFHDMYNAFINPNALRYVVKSGIEKTIAIGEKTFGAYGNKEVFAYWYQFRDMMEYKFKDIEFQREEMSENYKTAIETSFGESNTENYLYANYGVLVKRQNGDKINAEEVNQIEKGIENVNKIFGNLKDQFIKNNIKISHTGKKLVFAQKAVGVYITNMGTIAVSDKYGDIQFNSTLSHEIAHFIDNKLGQKNGRRWETDNYESIAGIIAFTFRNNMNKPKSEQTDYINATKECFARAMQQYFVMKKYGEDVEIVYGYGNLLVPERIVNQDIFVSKDKFNEKLKPLIEKLLDENKDFFNIDLEIKKIENEIKETIQEPIKEVTTESNELQEAIKTFEELIGFGGTDDEIKEWNEAIETFKMLI